MKTLPINLGILVSLNLGVSSASAATLISSNFTSVGLTATEDIDLTDPNIVDWGYYNIDNSFDPGTVDNARTSTDNGAVVVTPGALATATFNWSNTLPKFTVTFDNGNEPASGTVGIGAGFGAWAPDEDNAATFTFNDLGAGTHTVRVFAGHSSNDRIFDMDYSVTASDGNLIGNTVSSQITEGDLHSTYEIVFSTNDPTADLSLQFNSTSGGTGSGWIGGYVVENSAASSSEPVLTSPTLVGGEPGAWQFELTLKGKPETAYEFRTSTTLVFDPGILVLDLTQDDPANNPGTVGGADDSMITTDGNGDATVRLTLAGTTADFIRAEQVATGGE